MGEGRHGGQESTAERGINSPVAPLIGVLAFRYHIQWCISPVNVINNIFKFLLKASGLLSRVGSKKICCSNIITVSSRLDRTTPHNSKQLGSTALLVNQGVRLLGVVSC